MSRIGVAGLELWDGRAQDFVSPELKVTKRIRKTTQAQGIANRAVDKNTPKQRAMDIIHAYIRTTVFCSQSWDSKADMAWVLEMSKDFLHLLGDEKGLRKAIGEEANKVKTNTHESVKEFIKHNQELAGDEGARGRLDRHQVVTILGTGYASSVALKDAPWARIIAGWHLAGSKGYTGQEEEDTPRREQVNEYIKNNMKTTQHPDRMEVELLFGFAATSRPTKTFKNAMRAKSLFL